MNTTNYPLKESHKLAPESSCSEKIVVACGSDDRYGMPLSVTLSSLVKTLAKHSEVQIFVLSLGITPAVQDRIRRAATSKDVTVCLDFIEVDRERLNGLPERVHFTVATYLRILLPVLLPACYDKVLYLDSDLLVEQDLGMLWANDVGDEYLLATRDLGIPTVSAELGLYNWRQLGIPADAPYFNAGVLVVNLKKWRQDNLCPKLLDYVLEHRDHLRCADQDALNAVCYGGWGHLDLTWNVVPLHVAQMADQKSTPPKEYTVKTLDYLWQTPAIRHFASAHKPWMHGFKVPFQHEWLDALRKSEWFTPAEFRRWFIGTKITHYRNSINRRLFPRKT